jgi:hypothetical protein
VVDDVRGAFDDVVSSLRDYRSSIRRLVEVMHNMEYSDDEESESYGNNIDEEDDEEEEESENE